MSIPSQIRNCLSACLPCRLACDFEQLAALHGEFQSLAVEQDVVTVIVEFPVRAIYRIILNLLLRSELVTYTYQIAIGEKKPGAPKAVQVSWSIAISFGPVLLFCGLLRRRKLSILQTSIQSSCLWLIPYRLASH